MTIMVVSIIALIVIIILIAVGFIVWRRKLEAQASSLQKIEKQLEEIEVELRTDNHTQKTINDTDNSDCCIPLDPLQRDGRVPKKEGPVNKAAEEFDENINIATILQMKTTDLQNNNLNKEEEASASMYNVGKSGKIYTAEELDLLIKE